jgi:gliding motility-associated-like protein
MWNIFGPDFLSGWFMAQQVAWEFKYGTPEQKKIFGGPLCPGCDLAGSYTTNGSGDNQTFNFEAWQRWMARRLKEHAESFATEFGWRDQGGEVGTRIRMVIAGQFYATNGHAWNIGPGIEFLQRAYGNDAPGKYLYAVAVAPYFSTHANPDKETRESFLNMSIDEIERRFLENIDSYFQEFEPNTFDPSSNVRFGNFLEGLFAKARMFGLKMYSYEGGNELNTGGVDWGDGKRPVWENQKNADAFLSTPRAAAISKRFFDKWYSWFGYDAMFMKNGDYQGTPMGGYSMSHTLNEDLPMRMEYARIANNPAPPLSTERGNVLSGKPVDSLDARKLAAYQSSWNTTPQVNYHTEVNSDYTLKGESSYQRPFIIRCEKGGKYKFSIERGVLTPLANDQKWPTYCDIYLNEKLVVSGRNLVVNAISRNVKYPVDNYDRTFGWTEDLEIEIPYGVHVLRIKPSLPTPTRPGNHGFWGGNGKYNNGFDILQYKFKFDGALPPKKPKAILGEVNVCQSNTKAMYEIGEVDQGVCQYEWSGLPAGAKILPLELVAGSNPARYKSGQGTYKIYIDWGTVSVGEYSLKVVAQNFTGPSEPLIFKVKVQTCGFKIAPTPVCKGELTTFTPEPMAGISSYKWDNGEVGSDIKTRFTIKPEGTPITYRYMTPGTYSVVLTTFEKDASGKEIEKDQYHNTISVTACNEPIVATPVNYCKGATAQPLTAIINENSANPGVALKWYTSATGGVGTSAVTPTTDVAGTTSYYVSQTYSTGTESDRAKIDVIVKDAPAKPEVVGENPFNLCVGASSMIKAVLDKVKWAEGASIKWNTEATGGTSTANPPIPTVGQTNFKLYVSAEMGECESPRTELNIKEVGTLPDYTIYTVNPASCGAKGILGFNGLVANQPYQISYNGLPSVEMIPVSDGWNSRVILNVGPGIYNNFRVTLGGCTNTLNGPRTISNPGDDPAQGGYAKAENDKLPVGGSTNVSVLLSKGTISNWQVSKDGGEYVDITEKGASINTGALEKGIYSYKALLINGSCTEAVASTPATITVGGVTPLPKIDATTTTPTICSGAKASLSVSGQASSASFIWQQSVDGGNFQDITGATTSPYETIALEKTTKFRSKVTDGGVRYSDTVTVTVGASAVGGKAVADNAALSVGESTSIKLSQHTGDIKWEESTNGTSFTEISPAKSAITLEVGPFATAGNYYYRAKVTSGSCSAVYSSPDTITVKVVDPNKIDATTTTPTICSGAKASLSVSGQASTASFIWQQSVDGGDFQDIIGATTSPYETVALEETTKFRTKVTDGGVRYSDTVAVTLSASAVGGQAIADNAALSVGESTSIKLSQHTGDIKWEESTNGTSFTEISPAKSTITLEVGPFAAAGSYYYRAKVTSGSCSAVYSSPDTILVKAVDPNKIDATSTTPTICSGAKANLSVSGQASTASFIWQQSVDGGNFQDITGATTSPFETVALEKTTKFRTKVADGGERYSDTVVVTVNSSISGTASSEDRLLAPGEKAEIMLTGHTGQIKWLSSTDGNTFTEVETAGTETSYVTETLEIAGTYSYKARVTSGSCSPAFSNVIEIIVEQSTLPNPGTISTGTPQICAGATVTLISQDHEGTIEWQDSTSGIGFATLLNATTTPYTTSAINRETWYRTKVTGTNGVVVYSTPISIEVVTLEKPVLSGQPSYCNKGINKIIASPTSAEREVWALSPTLAGTIDQTGTVTWSSSYTGPVRIIYTVSSSSCTSESKTDSLKTQTTGMPSVGQIVGDSTVCRGRVVTYVVTPEVGVSYNWEVNTNVSLEKDDSKGMGKVTYLAEVPAEGLILKVTPESGMCGAGIPVTKVIMKGSGCDIFVPNVLTPETNDGYNVWQIEGIQNFPKLSIEVFNRWGDKVYTQTGGYNKPWDGTTQGKPLPTATYYYVIDKQDGSSKLTGSITVVRD